MSSRPRIIFDTNALISAAILPNSVSRKALLFALEHNKLIVSEDTWQEFAIKIEKPSLDRYFPSQESRLDFLLLVRPRLWLQRLDRNKQELPDIISVIESGEI